MNCSGPRSGELLRRDAPVFGHLWRLGQFVDRTIAERAPHALEGARVGVEHDHAPVAVAVGDEELVRRRVHERIGRALHIRRVRVSLARALLAELHQEPPLLVELHQVMIGRTVAADPDVAARIDIDAVLDLGPIEALPGSAPRLDEIPQLVELDHRWCGFVLLVGAQAARALEHPGVPLLVDRDARHLPEDVARRQFGPGRIDLEPRRLAGGLRRGRGRRFGVDDRDRDSRDRDGHGRRQHRTRDQSHRTLRLCVNPVRTYLRQV